MLGPKGGTGKTLDAVQPRGRARGTPASSVALVDLDLQFGDVGLALGLEPERTIYDLATSGGSLDAEKLEDYLADARVGRTRRCSRRPARTRPASITVEFLREVYAMLRATHDYVIVDTPPGLHARGDRGDRQLDAQSAWSGMLDSLSLKNTKLGPRDARADGLRHASGSRWCSTARTAASGISHEDVVTISAAGPDVLVPSDREIAARSTTGEPIVLSGTPVGGRARRSRRSPTLFAAERTGWSSQPSASAAAAGAASGGRR